VLAWSPGTKGCAKLQIHHEVPSSQVHLKIRQVHHETTVLNSIKLKKIKLNGIKPHQAQNLLTNICSGPGIWHHVILKHGAAEAANPALHTVVSWPCLMEMTNLWGFWRSI